MRKTSSPKLAAVKSRVLHHSIKHKVFKSQRWHITSRLLKPERIDAKKIARISTTKARIADPYPMQNLHLVVKQVSIEGEQ